MDGEYVPASAGEAVDIVRIAHATANTFVQMLTAQTRRLPTQPGMRNANAGGTSEPTVRTFGIPAPSEDPAPGADNDELNEAAEQVEF